MSLARFAWYSPIIIDDIGNDSVTVLHPSACRVALSAARMLARLSLYNDMVTGARLGLHYCTVFG